MSNDERSGEAGRLERVESGEPGFGSGLAVGGLLGAVIVGSLIYWRDQRRRAKEGVASTGGCASGTCKVGEGYGPLLLRTGYAALPAGCTASPPRRFAVMQQMESFVPPTSLGPPTILQPRTPIRVAAVLAAIRDTDGRVRCDVSLEGDDRLLAAFLGADDFAPGPCRDAFVAVTTERTI